MSTDTKPPTVAEMKALATSTVWAYADWERAARLLGHERMALWPAVVEIASAGYYPPQTATRLAAIPPPGLP